MPPQQPAARARARLRAASLATAVAVLSALAMPMAVADHEGPHIVSAVADPATSTVTVTYDMPVTCQESVDAAQQFDYLAVLPTEPPTTTTEDADVIDCADAATPGPVVVLTFEPGTFTAGVSGTLTYTPNTNSPEAQIVDAQGRLAAAQTVTIDLTAPTVVSAAAAFVQTVRVDFDEPVTCDDSPAAAVQFTYTDTDSTAVVAEAVECDNADVPAGVVRVRFPDGTVVANDPGSLTYTPSATASARVVDASGNEAAGFTVAVAEREPTVTVADQAVGEAAGTVNVVVGLSEPSATDVTFDYTTADGTALAGDDYTATSAQAVTIAAGQTEATIAVPIIDDTLDEVDETFTVSVSGVTNATPAAASATVTIIDDDPPPTVSVVGNPLVTEGTGRRPAVFATLEVRLSAASSQPVSVDFETRARTATGDVDFVARANDLHFAPGETTRTVRVRILGDRLDEPVERFRFVLTGATNADLGDLVGVVRILDDDAEPKLSVSDVSRLEGDRGDGRLMRFFVQLSDPSAFAVTFDFSTLELSGQAAALEGRDYRARSGTRVIPAGDSETEIRVRIRGDNRREQDERFGLRIGNVKRGDVGTRVGVATIVDDD